MGNWGWPADAGCLQNFIITIAGGLFNCFALLFTFLTWRVERICLFIRYGLCLRGARFLERKLGKELCAKLRFASAPAWRYDMGWGLYLPARWTCSVGADIIRPSFWNRIKLLEVGRGRCLIGPLYQGTNGCVDISPAGESLLQRCKRNQKTAGGRRLEKHSVFLCRLPRTPCFFTGEPPRGVEKICPARAKDRIPFLTPPAAAPCWLNRYLLLQEQLRLAFFHRVAVQWSLRLRGWRLGEESGCSTPELLVCSGLWIR